MRLNKWIVAGLSAVGWAFTGAQHASALTVADLYGTWTGTYTPLATPTPTEIFTSGIRDTTLSSSPESLTVSFSQSNEFAFGFQFGAAGSAAGTGWLPMTQTAASFSGDSVSWTVDQYVSPPGGKVDTDQMQFNGTITLSNPQTLALDGQWKMTPLVSDLPADSGVGGVILFNADFSLSTAAPTTSVVPLPPAAWSALAMLGGLAVVQYIRTRRRLA